jgi:hypothetical protein
MAPVKKDSASLSGKTVQELQAIAAVAATASAPQKTRRLSRAAQLHLIDQLSRWGGSGLAMFAGASIFIAIVPARDMPVRMSVWAALIFASLYLCRRYRKEFRRGDRIASRPFRWRAYYASTLAVVSAAFGAGAFLIHSEGAGERAAAEMFGVMAITALAAAAFHAPHRASAAAAGIPALSAIAFASASTPGLAGFTTLLLVGGAIGIALVAGLVRATERRAELRFPRTAIQRREADRRRADTIAYKDAERAAG